MGRTKKAARATTQALNQQRRLVLDRQGGGEPVDVIEFVFSFHVGCVGRSLGRRIYHADRQGLDCVDGRGRTVGPCSRRIAPWTSP